MPRQSDYQFVSADTLKELEARVNKMLEEGFVAVGSPVVKNLHVGQGRVHQAVVRDFGVSSVSSHTVIKHDMPHKTTDEDGNSWRPTWDTGDHEESEEEDSK